MGPPPARRWPRLSVWGSERRPTVGRAPVRRQRIQMAGAPPPLARPSLRHLRRLRCLRRLRRLRHRTTMSLGWWRSPRASGSAWRSPRASRPAWRSPLASRPAWLSGRLVRRATPAASRLGEAVAPGVWPGVAVAPGVWPGVAVAPGVWPGVARGLARRLARCGRHPVLAGVAVAPASGRVAVVLGVWVGLGVGVGAAHSTVFDTTPDELSRLEDTTRTR